MLASIICKTRVFFKADYLLWYNKFFFQTCMLLAVVGVQEHWWPQFSHLGQVEDNNHINVYLVACIDRKQIKDLIKSFHQSMQLQTVRERPIRAKDQHLEGTETKDVYLYSDKTGDAALVTFVHQDLQSHRRQPELITLEIKIHFYDKSPCLLSSNEG